MIEWLQSDAACWTLGSLPGAIGLYLFLRGVIGRRPRGKPTCWRCRYDMTGAAGLACPECGHVHGDAKQFLKTRRVWKRAARSLAMGILANMQSRARDALPRLCRLLDETHDPMLKEQIAWAIELIEMEQETDIK